jgi:hypothetical protein
VQQSKHADAPLMETEKSFAYLPGFWNSGKSFASAWFPTGRPKCDEAPTRRFFKPFHPNRNNAKSITREFLYFWLIGISSSCAAC